MADIPPTEIGHGVTVTLNPEGSIEIRSTPLALPLQVRRGHLPGTVVAWGEALFEVVAEHRDEQPARFLAFPWRDGDVARRVFRLDAENLARLADEMSAAGARRRTRGLTAPLLPLMGLAPAPLQQRWANEFGFPIGRAVAASAVLELMLGMAGVLQALALPFSGVWFLPAGLHWLVPIGAWLAPEGMFRLAWTWLSGEPLGSVFGLPLLLIVPVRPGPGTGPPRPTVLRHDPDARCLELASPMARPDWPTGAVLPFRGRHWRVVGLRSHAAPWVYAFERCEPVAEDAMYARLAPPRAAEAETPPPRPRSLRFIGRRTVETALFALAPRAEQLRWGAARGTRPVLVTAVCGALEAYGGLLNLHAFGSAEIWLLALDLGFFAEGLWRIGTALLTRQPCGSVLGLPLRSYYRGWRAD
jgi:hypothetical protein